MKSFKFPRPSAEIGILASIFIGITGYLIFAWFMYRNVQPANDTYRSIVEMQRLTTLDSTYTDAGLDLKDFYLRDVRRIDKEADTVISKILVDKVERPNYFYKKSRLLKEVVFSSEDEAFLHFTISGLDLKYAKVLGKTDIPNPYFMNRNPKLALWILLISIAVGFTFFLSPLFYSEIRRYSSGLSTVVRVRNVLFSILIFILLVVPLFLPHKVYPGILFKPTDVSIFFDAGFSNAAIMSGATVPFVCAIFWLILIFTVNSKISQLYKVNSASMLLQFKIIKADVEKYFIAIAFFLAFTIFCKDTLLTTLNALSSKEPMLFPKEFAFSNGLIQTFFLVLIYFGIQANFSRIKKGIYLNDSIKKEEKEALEEETSFFNYVKVILTMLAPLLGSGIQDLLGLVAG
ncbi:MAG: hypothetical protein AAF617_07525 [Bacteroidota bacterium]